MGPLMVLEGQQVVVAFLAHQTSEDASLMRLLMVKQRAGVPVASAALVAPVGFFSIANRPEPTAGARTP